MNKIQNHVKEQKVVLIKKMTENKINKAKISKKKEAKKKIMDKIREIKPRN